MTRAINNLFVHLAITYTNFKIDVNDNKVLVHTNFQTAYLHCILFKHDRVGMFN